LIALLLLSRDGSSSSTFIGAAARYQLLLDATIPDSVSPLVKGARQLLRLVLRQPLFGGL